MNLNKSQLTNIMNAFFYLITAEPFILSLVPYNNRVNKR